MTCLVTKHLKFYSRWNEQFIWYLSHISLIHRLAAIWIISFLKSMDRGSLQFQHYLFIENISTNSKAFQFWYESLVNGLRTSNVWSPSNVCAQLEHVMKQVSVTCLRLDENDGISSFFSERIQWKKKNVKRSFKI